MYFCDGSSTCFGEWLESPSGGCGPLLRINILIMGAQMALCKSPIVDKYDLSSLRWMMTGAA